MRHAIVILFAAVCFVAPSSTPGWAQTSAPPPAENLAAARELVQVMKATDQFKALLPTIMQGLKPSIVQGRPEVEKDYDAIMPVILDGANRRVSQLGDMLADIYARNFSVAEIHDLEAFYQSPTGQKLLQRQPVIARQSMTAGQQWGQQLVSELKEEINEELRKREAH